MLGKLKFGFGCAVSKIAAHFGMVYVDLDLIRLSMDQERYLKWLYNALEVEGHEQTMDELKHHMDQQKLMTNYLQAGRSMIAR
jgi:hypothetical protein